MNKDMLYLLAIKLDYKSLSNLCLSSKQINNKIGNEVWRYKLNQDFPNCFIKNEKLKECYILLNKPVLIFIFSDVCGASMNFKKEKIYELEKELMNDTRLTFDILDFPTLKIPNLMSTMSYHPELKNNFIRFFPTFMLVPGNIWNNHKSKLKAVVKHGNEEEPKIDYSVKGILSWIDETLTKNSLFI